MKPLEIINEISKMKNTPWMELRASCMLEKISEFEDIAIEIIEIQQEKNDSINKMNRTSMTCGMIASSHTCIQFHAKKKEKKKGFSFFSNQMNEHLEPTEPKV